MAVTRSSQRRSREGEIAAAMPQQHPALAQIDPSTAFLYTPHTITALLTGWFVGERFGVRVALLGESTLVAAVARPPPSLPANTNQNTHA
jgi:hypothetical protein